MSNLDRRVFTCNCGGHHYFEIWKWSDESDWSICFIERPIGLKEKARKIWQVIRGEDVFDAEIYPESYREFAKAVQTLSTTEQEASKEERDSE